MITFVAEVSYPKGPGIICAVSFQPIFRTDGSVDLELTFLATRLNAEGSGMAIWLIFQALNCLKSIKINNIYVQSCSGEGHEKTLRFYHRLGKSAYLSMRFVDSLYP